MIARRTLALAPLRASLLSWLAVGLLLPAGAVRAARRDTLEQAAQAIEHPRRVDVRGEWFYVDGEPFLVKGIGYSPTRPGQVPWGMQTDPAVMERDFRLISEAGFNTIRTWSPLSDEGLALARKYHLMVLQGIWIDRNGDYTSSAFREAMFNILRRETQRAMQHDNILALIVGNELLPDQVYRAGIPETEALLKRAAQVVKETDPHRVVTYANWPSLAFLDASMWDTICFNLYPYEPASVAHSFGFRSYVEHLKDHLARNKPLIITEMGLSVSKGTGRHEGYGGNSLGTQRTELLKLWDGLFQGGAQGGTIFEWNDEWWKQSEFYGDAKTHEDADPEEWFGITEFKTASDVDVTPRPAYAALKAYNQAVLLSPVHSVSYDEQLPVTVYATERVASVRFRLGKPKGWMPSWNQATRLNRHWWKAAVPVDPKLQDGTYPFVLEALDEQGRVVARRERPVIVRHHFPNLRVTVTTDKQVYEVGRELQSAHFTISVLDEQGRGVPNHPVHFAIIEPLAQNELVQDKRTNLQGLIEGDYLINEPGIVGISAAAGRNPDHSPTRVGDETFFVVRQRLDVVHQPSPWEAGLPAPLQELLQHATPAFRLADEGTETVVDYGRYGEFRNVGTPQYHYEVTNWEGLAAAVGEGIYPNEGGLLHDPAFKAAQEAGTLTGSHWDFTFHKDPQVAFFKWASTDEEPGVKQFYTAVTLERAGLWGHAVKAYYNILVHFPTSVGWTAFDPPTPWYPARTARDRLEAILRLHPELGLRLEGADVHIDHVFDNDTDNDVFSVTPGRLVKVEPSQVNPPTADVSRLPHTREIGKGSVRLVRYENGHWQLLINGKPWVIRGITYKPSAVGESPDEGTLRDWTLMDRNKNGTLDAFDTFVDANRNNRQDPDEPTVGDFELLRRMGVNTIRLYHTDQDAKAAKAVLRQLYQQYGFRVIMGDFVGMYTVGSGATWEKGTDYLDPEQRKRMFQSVKKMVKDFKDEPYLLLWVLGNENNYGGVHGIVGGAGNAGKYPKEYYTFINELATWIHQEDPNHPVAVGNGDQVFLDVMATQAPAIDIFGANVYRGWFGFGRSFFDNVRRVLDRPVLITEYGCPAYQTDQPAEIAERDQAFYHFGNWVDIVDNVAGRGVGNAIGGIAFEWSDEWWKAGQPPRFSPTVQETHPNWAGPYPGGWNFEEWYGLVGQGDGSASPYLRQPRVSYETYRSLWNPQPPPSADSAH